MVSSEAIGEAVDAAVGVNDYPLAMNMMLAAGILRYQTDVKTHVIVYSSDDAAHTKTGAAPVPADEPVVAYDKAAMKAADAAFGRGDTDYVGFLRGLWHAGVVAYDVDMVERTITFCGSNGETRVVNVPLPN